MRDHIEEEPFILGILMSQFFNQPSSPGFIGTYTNYYPFLIGGEKGDGSGGYPNGHSGKEAYLGSGGDLSGAGGGLDGGGDGLKVGLFGYGGHGSAYCSAGGGGGFFGGGSGYSTAGAGGGSSYVWDGNCPIAEHMQTLELYAALGPTYNPSDYLPVGDIEYDYNANFGHGYIKINGQRFDYTGTVQEYEVVGGGLFEIECFGAQGGTASSMPDCTSKYTGGCGGRAKATFYLKAGTKLYLYVGEHNNDKKAPLRTFGGGGGGAGRGWAGGGATDVRLVENDLYSRIITAGGGGALVGSGGDRLPLGGKSSSEMYDSSLLLNKKPSVSSGKNMYVVSDLSVIYADLTYNTTQDVKGSEYIRATLYVEGVNRGSSTLTPAPGGTNSTSFVFNADSWLSEGTSPEWQTIEVVIETNFGQFIIPVSGLTVRVETKTRANDKAALLTKIFGIVRDYVQYGTSFKIEMVNPIIHGDLKELEHIASGYEFDNLFKVLLEYVPREGIGTVSSNELGSVFKIELTTPPKDTFINVLSQIAYESMCKIEFKLVPRLNIDVVSSLGFGAYDSISMPQQIEDIEHLEYSTHNELGSYTAVFLKAVGRVNTNIHSVNELGSYTKVELQSPPGDTVIKTTSGTAYEVLFKIELKEVPKLNTNIVSNIEMGNNSKIIL